KTFDKVRVATRRTAHASDVTGALGPLEAVIEYSDVHFDAPFGEEVWSGMPPEPAESPSPAIPAAAGRLGPLDAASPPGEETR
ncbi:MAG TPA: hypothetical protein VKF61_02935, partial [Candidatus Polarisedimenticolia bacterium]|nr:hypothetical protein [Candidatus Polarisedimenticolia bacterium]